MMEWWAWFLLFYAIVAGLWTYCRYYRTQDKERWVKNLPVHIVESLWWLPTLLKKEYEDPEE